MLTRDQNDIRPNYLVEVIAVTVIALCIGLNVGGNIGVTTLDSKPADGFSGFKMVNVSHHHHNDLASNQ